MDDRNVPIDVEMVNNEENTHQFSTDPRTAPEGEEDSLYDARATSLPPISTIDSSTSPTTEEDSTDLSTASSQEDISDRRFSLQNPPPADFDFYNAYNDSRLTRNQCDCAFMLQRVLKRLQSYILPLTAIRFGSRTSHRSFNRLHEAVPTATLQQFFPEYSSYTQLANTISTIRTDHRKAPNRWQTYIPRIRRI